MRYLHLARGAVDMSPMDFLASNTASSHNTFHNICAAGILICAITTSMKARTMGPIHGVPLMAGLENYIDGLQCNRCMRLNLYSNR